MIRVEVDAPNAGARLDRLVAGVEGVGSRTVAARLVEEGRVLVDGEARHRAFRVLPGMTVEVDVPDPARALPVPDASVPFSHPSTRTSTCSWSTSPPASSRTRRPAAATARWCTACWREQVAGGDDPLRPGIVHRLDQDTSGLLVVARTDEAHRALGRLLRRRVIEREYLALVHGRPPARAGRIEAPIGRDPGHRTRMAVDGVSARAGGHALRAGGGAARLHAAAPAPGDGPHAPDPRAPGGDRPPRRRRPGLRAGRAPSGSGLGTPVPARRAPGASRTR